MELYKFKSLCKQISEAAKIQFNYLFLHIELFL